MKVTLLHPPVYINKHGLTALRPSLPLGLAYIAAALRDLPLSAFDLAEVAPNWDPTGRPPAIGAAVLFAILEPKLFAIERFGLRG